ncbi:MAG: hypothetical protein KatS3mg110_2926 [Pirellulaceae bacterium]|nr:MAG: hypothetical protein KatS3mg110_2926 [Pirellulaceae bacterium]
MAQYDAAYRRLFAHPRLVRDLLEGFVKLPWVTELDWTTLESIPPKFVSPGLRVFEADLIWKVVHRPSGLPIYIVMELQARIERWMAARMVNYSVQLSLRLMREPQAWQRGLPVVLPLVFYHGRTPWTPPTDFRALHRNLPASWEPFVPSWPYFLVDVHAMRQEELPSNNTVSYVARLEQASRPAEVVDILRELGRWLQDPQEEVLRRAFYEWVVQLVIPRWRRGSFSWDRVGNFEQGVAMLAERWREWRREWMDQARQEGRRKGLREGRREGLREGRREGLREGRQLGLLEGERQLLLHQLRRKFGRVTKQVRERIRKADSPELLLWAERLITATKLADIFEDGSESQEPPHN